MGAIVSLYRRAKGRGGQVTLRNVRDQPLEILKLLKLDEILIDKQASSAAP